MASTSKHHYALLNTFLVLSLMGMLFPAVSLAAAEVRISPQVGSVDEPFTLQIITDQELEEAPQLPSVAGVEIRHAGQSSNYSWINGQSTREIIQSYSVSVDKPGKYVIPSFSLKLAGKSVQTPALSFQATKGSASVDGDNETAPLVFMKQEFSKQSPYVGEPIVSTVKLYRRTQIGSASKASERSSDFKYYDLDQTNHREEVDGIIYEVIEAKEIMVPLKSGTIPLEPYKISLQVIVQNNRNRNQHDFFEMFNSNRRAIQKTISAEAQTLEVKPLPLQGKPAGYQGVVGEFQLQAELNQNHLKASETATLTLTVTGKGLLDNLDPPELQVPADIKVYQDKPEISEKADPVNGVISTKTFKYALVPTKAGSYPLGTIQVPIFHITQNAYRTLQSQLPTLEVSASDEKKIVIDSTTHQVTGSEAKQDVRALGQDLVDIHRDKQALLSSPTPFTTAFYLLFWLPLVFLLTSGFYRFKSLHVDPSKSRKTRALQQFNLRTKDKADDPLLTFVAFKEYLGDKFNRHGQALTTQEILELLKTLQFSPESFAGIEAVVKLVETLEFSNQPINQQQSQDIIATINKTLEFIEKKI